MAKQFHNSNHLDLVSQGWERRFSAEDPRLTEMSEYYQSLGFETLVVDGVVGDETICRSCFDAPGFEGRYKTLYTRTKATVDQSDDQNMF
ncbi:MAG: hypothetical protein ACP5VS_08480 [Desulfomonilaceae bacterium]